MHVQLQLPSTAPKRPPAVLERVRALLGPGNPAADDVVEAMRLELRREYERGYFDGKGGDRRHKNESRFHRFRRHLERDLRHGGRQWLIRTQHLRRTILSAVVVVVLTAGAVALSLHLAGSEKKFTFPTVTK